MRSVLLVVFGALLWGCWEPSPPPQVPEECKVTTNPEACRKAYQR